MLKIPFHLNIIKGPGEFDLAIGLFRQQKLDLVVRQMATAKNDQDLPDNADIPLGLRISSIGALNAAENLWRIEGWADLCVGGEWFGRHSSYHFAAQFSSRKRMGIGAIWHK